MAEKTEKATPKKLRDARKKGQVAKSQDMSSAFTFIISFWSFLALLPFIYSHISGFIKTVFGSISKQDHLTLILKYFGQIPMIVLITSLPVLGLVAITGVAINFMVVGPLFATEVFKFDIKKFDPVQNLKAKFKLKTLVELLKSIFKISIAAYIMWGVLYNQVPN